MDVVLETGDNGHLRLSRPYGWDGEKVFDIPQSLWEDWCAMEEAERELHRRAVELVERAKAFA